MERFELRRLERVPGAREDAVDLDTPTQRGLASSSASVGGTWFAQRRAPASIFNFWAWVA
jgi:hypothetical protein